MLPRPRPANRVLIVLPLLLLTLLSVGNSSPAPKGHSSGLVARAPAAVGSPLGRGANTGPAYVPGEVLIRFKDDASPSEHASARAQVSAQRLRQFRSGAEHWKLAGGETTESAITRLRNNPHVRYVEPNYIVR